MALPVADYPGTTFNGNEQTQPILPEGGTDVANASDYNKATTEIVAVEDDLRAANAITSQDNHEDVHSDQETRIVALESSGGGAAATFKHIASRFYGPVPTFASTRGVSADDIDIIPIEIPEDGSYDAMGLTAAGGFGGSVIFAVYDSDSGGFPKTKLKDLGSTTVLPTTLLSVTSFALTAGFRWLAMIISSPVTMQTISRTSERSAFESLTGRASLTDIFQSGFSVSGGSFASGLPADLTTLGTPTQLANPTHINIRKA